MIFVGGEVSLLIPPRGDRPSFSLSPFLPDFPESVEGRRLEGSFNEVLAGAMCRVLLPPPPFFSPLVSFFLTPGETRSRLRQRIFVTPVSGNLMATTR